MIEKIQHSSSFIASKTPHQDFSGSEKQPLDQKSWDEGLAQTKMSREKIQEMVDSLNKFLTPLQTSLKFELHDKLNEYYVTIIDSETKEVVKEIPPKKMLDIYAAIAEQLGLIIDKKI